MPMFHAFINVAVFPTLRAGGQVITVPKFEPSTYIEALSRYKVFQIEQHTILLAIKYKLHSFNKRAESSVIFFSLHFCI